MPTVKQQARAIYRETKAKGVPERCDDECDHTDEEHWRFDAGVEAGRRGLPQSACPFRNFNRAEDWLVGHSVGYIYRQTGEN